MVHYSFLKKWAIPGHFFFIFVFSIQFIVNRFANCPNYLLNWLSGYNHVMALPPAAVVDTDTLPSSEPDESSNFYYEHPDNENDDDDNEEAEEQVVKPT